MKQAIIRALIEKIIVFDDKIRIFLNIQRHPPRLILGRCLPIPVRIVPIWWSSSNLKRNGKRFDYSRFS